MKKVAPFKVFEEVFAPDAWLAYPNQDEERRNWRWVAPRRDCRPVRFEDEELGPTRADYEDHEDRQFYESMRNIDARAVAVFRAAMDRRVPDVEPSSL